MATVVHDSETEDLAPSAQMTCAEAETAVEVRHHHEVAQEEAFLPNSQNRHVPIQRRLVLPVAR